MKKILISLPIVLLISCSESKDINRTNNTKEEQENNYQKRDQINDEKSINDTENNIKKPPVPNREGKKTLKKQKDNIEEQNTKDNLYLPFAPIAPACPFAPPAPPIAPELPKSLTISKDQNNLLNAIKSGNNQLKKVAENNQKKDNLSITAEAIAKGKNTLKKVTENQQNTKHIENNFDSDLKRALDKIRKHTGDDE